MVKREKLDCLMRNFDMTVESFGTLASGEPITQYTMRNASGMSISVINLGAIVTSIKVPDRKGVLADVVTGFDYLAAYEAGHPYFGAVVGRIAGRLSGGRLVVDGKSYTLAINDPPNHLHGGVNTFDKKVWKFIRREDALVELGYHSPDGEEGYPGNVDVRVTYELTDANEWVINYHATTDQATPLSLTNHAWFNLAGEGSANVFDHTLQIFADVYVPADEKMTLQGKCVPVEGTSSDFRKPRKLGEAIPLLHAEHGDNYVFPGSKKDVCQKIARAVHEESGRVMEVFTTERCLQFYSGKVLDGHLIGKSGKAYQSHGAFCLECHGYPDGPNQPEIEDIILRPGRAYRQTTKYAFKAR